MQLFLSKLIVQCKIVLQIHRNDTKHLTLEFYRFEFKHACNSGVLSNSIFGILEVVQTHFSIIQFEFKII